jgi:DNA-binding transcriptional LysR family regulator
MITGNWSALELRHLAALVAVAEEGSFAGAAGRLGYTQAAVSQQVAALERIVGARLIRRSAGRRPQGVTRSGKVVLNYARVVLAKIQAVQSELATATTQAALRIGSCASIGAQVLPEVTERFFNRLPNVSVELVDGLSDMALLTLVKDGELDLAFMGVPAERAAFDTLELLDDPYVLAIPVNSPLDTAGGVPPSYLGELPLIGYRTCAEGSQLEQQLRAHGVTPRYRLRTDNHQVLRDLVVAGVGYGLVPRLAIPTGDTRLAVVPIEGLRPRQFGVLRRKGKPAGDALRSYLEITADYCAELRRSRQATP